MGLERLAMMFCGTVSYERGARSTDVHSLTRSELAALMTRMDGIEVDYVYAYLGDENSKTRLLMFAYRNALRLSIDQHWFSTDEKKIDQINVMARTAVSELIDCTCKSCRGTGFIEHRLCKRCIGSGISRLSDRQIAKSLNVCPSTYSRCWKNRYDQTYLILQDVKCSVQAKLRQNEKDYFIFA